MATTISPARFIGCLAVGCVALVTTPILAQNAVGVFTENVDVGGSSGSAVFDEASGEYTITAFGSSTPRDQDQLHFAWRRIDGDFILNAMASFSGDGVGARRNLGWMVRPDLSDRSPYISISVHGDGLVTMQFRRSDGADTEQVRSTVRNAGAIQLSREGDTYTASAARTGEVFASDHIADLELGDRVYVGLFVGARDEAASTAIFRNVSVTVPAPSDFTPYREYIGGNLEILNVATGHRETVMRSPHPIQAPNWTPDGKNLIYNDRGLLYRFDLATHATEVLDTGFADRNNNDHVLSFDGKRIAISHHSADHDGLSIIYWLPAAGGEPQQVTDLGPSYLHGWSPDGKHLTYTGGRNDIYNIYAIPVTGGPEIQLTDTPGLDDGPEYSPDGSYIYFNSTRSGKMKLWRMDTDGSNPEQLTFDEMNDWFPHISPDGEWIVFLSYEREVDPAAHPWYKQVYLRLLPVDGPEGVRPRVIAYLYGGQGTINVPSWSPDSKYVAFVSNTASNEN